MKISKILIEGPDCSGKDTLVENLKNRFKWDSKALHHKPGSQFDRYLKEYSTQRQIVFNRGHISEQAYSELWRGGDPFTIEEFLLLDKIFSQNGIVIFCIPALETLQKRYKNRKFSQQLKYEELPQCREIFLKLMKRLPCLVYHSENYEELNNFIKNIEEKYDIDWNRD